MPRRITFLSIFFLMLSACGVLSPQPKPMVELSLLPLIEGPADFLLKQKLTMEALGESQQFMAVIRLEKEVLKLRVFLATGQPIFSLDYDSHTLIQKQFSTNILPGKEILAMIQFALWPEPLVKEYYNDAKGWQLNCSSEKRVLKLVNEDVLHVNYLSSEALVIDNMRHHYRVSIEALE